MKSISVFIFLCIFYLLAGCEKEAEVKPRDYPYVITKEPAVSTSGADLSADLVNLGTQEIINYGFVWNDRSNPTILDNRMLFYDDPETGIYSHKVQSGLIDGALYYVRAYIETGQVQVYGNEITFSSLGSLPPSIKSFTPTFGPIDTQVIIQGENFSTSIPGVVVKFGSRAAKIDSLSDNRIIVRVPEITQPEKVHITVETAGMQATSDEIFDLWFPWVRKNDFSNLNSNTANFTIGTLGYVINVNKTYMLIYDPESDLWQADYNLPENSGVPHAFASGGRGYALLSEHFWEFDPAISEWSILAEFPGTLQDDDRWVYDFYLDGHYYLGNCYRSYELWEYDVSQDLWQQKEDFIGNFSASNPVWGSYSFSVNHKGYLGIARSIIPFSLWEYDPVQDFWTSKTPIPSYDRWGQCELVINNEVFIGLGHNEVWPHYLSNEIWKYDCFNDTWIKYRDCPVYMQVYASLTINGKGYIAGHNQYHGAPLNVWEFDPLKN